MDCYRCLIQWGLSTGQADLTTILPFPMTESFISLCCSNSYWTNAGCYVSNTAITLSQAQTDKASTRHDGPLCWLVFGKQPQWRNNPGLWAIPFTEFVAGGITMTRTGSQSSGTWYGDSGTISLTGYTASCATNESWVSSISGSAIAVGL